METTRNYGMSNTVLLEHAGKVLAYLPEDLEQFTAFDPDLNGEVQEGLSHLYHRALGYGTDSTERSVVKKYTEDVNLELKKCSSIYNEVRYFASKCFGNSPATLRQFGINKYRKVRNSQPNMIVFMFELDNTVTKYKEELMQAGLKESVILSIPQAAHELEQANLVQEVGKNHRSVKTEVRIVMLNDMYGILVRFNKASKIVFIDDPLRRERYSIPSNGHSAPKTNGNDTMN